MSTDTKIIDSLVEGEYKWGFVTEVESDSTPKGLNEDTIHLISTKKNEPEFMLEWRLKAFRHWLKLLKQGAEPKWANIKYDAIDYQDIICYSAPKHKKAGPKSLDEVDPEILLAYEKLGLPLNEQKRLAGVAVDAVFDSVSVATTFQAKPFPAMTRGASILQACKSWCVPISSWKRSIRLATNSRFQAPARSIVPTSSCPGSILCSDARHGLVPSQHNQVEALTL